MYYTYTSHIQKQTLLICKHEHYNCFMKSSPSPAKSACCFTTIGNGLKYKRHLKEITEGTSHRHGQG